jgi:hypothetical protein
MPYRDEEDKEVRRGRALATVYVAAGASIISLGVMALVLGHDPTNNALAAIGLSYIPIGITFVFQGFNVERTLPTRSKPPCGHLSARPCSALDREEASRNEQALDVIRQAIIKGGSKRRQLTAIQAVLETIIRNATTKCGQGTQR